MQKDGFKGTGSSEDDLYNGKSIDSSEFLTEAKNIMNIDEDIFIYL